MMSQTLLALLSIIDQDYYQIEIQSDRTKNYSCLLLSINIRDTDEILKNLKHMKQSTTSHYILPSFNV